MHLIHAATLRLETFPDHRARPPYAILSHTWSDGEVLYKDILDCANGTQTPDLNWQKIQGARRQARKYGIEWIWIDTCCIDKTSSAELSEAINSMFKWYQKSAVCYAYISDVQKTPSSQEGELMSSFRQSKWFTRGWTLQELIAPSQVLFFDRDWQFMDDREALSHDIHLATGLPIQLLMRHRTAELHDFSVAMRMAWASRRHTTRIEDEAYCLMGLFDVNMPLLYGEGAKAFVRLQMEIARVSDDHSIFAWRGMLRALFAPSPAYFSEAWAIARVEGISRPRYELTKRGLRIALRMRDQSSNTEGGPDMGILDCVDLRYPHVLIALPLDYRGGTENGTKIVSVLGGRVLRFIDGRSTEWPRLATKTNLLLVESFDASQDLAPRSVQLYVTKALSASSSLLSVDVHPADKWQQSRYHSTELSGRWAHNYDIAQNRVIHMTYDPGYSEYMKGCIHFIVAFGCRHRSGYHDGECDVFLITSTSTSPNIAFELFMGTGLRDMWVERNKESTMEQHVYNLGQAELPMEASFVLPQGVEDHGERWPSRASIREMTTGVDGRGWAIIIE